MISCFSIINKFSLRPPPSSSSSSSTTTTTSSASSCADAGCCCVLLLQVYQKCHDPDCRNFRSAPLKVIPRYAMDADLDSADLDAAVSLEEEVRDLS